MYTTYEAEIKGKYKEAEMQMLYNKSVNKQEYVDFDSWVHDMIKSGIFIKGE